MELGLGMGLKHRPSAASAPPPSFTPSALAGLKLWLDASDTSTITTGATFTWADKSGNGYNATQTSATSQPVTGTRTLNSLNTLDFDGSNDKLNLPSGLYSLSQGNNTVFIVSATDTTAKTAQFILSGTNAGSSRYRISYLSSGTQHEVLNGSTSLPGTYTVNTNGHIHAMLRSSTNLYGLVDGTIIASSTTAGASNVMDAMAIGTQANNTSNGFDGRIGEIVIYNRNLSSAEANLVQTYLSTKWGVSVSTISWLDLSIVGFGDSVTAGLNASTTPNRWLNLIAGDLNASLVNAGISGTPLQNTNRTTTGTPYTNNGRDRYSATLTGVNKQDRVYIMYGVNDIRLYTNGEISYSASAFSTQLNDIVSGLINSGYTSNQIYIGTTPYFIDSDNPTMRGAMATAAYNVATTHSTYYADIYQYMSMHGGATLLSGDNIHPNDNGHDAIRDAFLLAVKL